MNLTKAEVLALLEALSLLNVVESFDISPDSELGGFCHLTVCHTLSAKRKLEAEFQLLK